MIRNVLLISISVLFVGCATHAELGGNHVAVVLTAEERSAFGTNVVYSKLQHCEKKFVHGGEPFYDAVNCTDLTGWTPASSQGVGGQIVGGALTGLGFGLGSAFSGAGNAASSISNSTTNVVTKGGHH